jgi:peptidoglycan/xylan/chitin deacetylase (PgdA/CDA1 family)
VDDLPWVGGLAPDDSRVQATERILQAFERASLHVTGFVVCHELRREGGPELVRRWLRHGHELGNHTTSHRSLNELPWDDWPCDVRSCQSALVELQGLPVRWFRFPMLQSGSTRQTREDALALLREQSTIPAPVSIDTSDGLLASFYEQALAAHDPDLAQTIGRAYVDHVLRAADHYRDRARSSWHRPVAHILLLHANGLLADRGEELLHALRTRGWSFISLAEALPDGYVGRIGLSWLYRVAEGPAAPGAWRWDEAEAQALTERFSVGPAHRLGPQRAW